MNKSKYSKMADGSIPECATHKPMNRELGYLAWFAWADGLHKKGIRQSQCKICTRWLYPEEI